MEPGGFQQRNHVDVSVKMERNAKHQSQNVNFNNVLWRPGERPLSAQRGFAESGGGPRGTTSQALAAMGNLYGLRGHLDPFSS